jgi:hypothetical protein
VLIIFVFAFNNMILIIFLFDYYSIYNMGIKKRSQKNLSFFQVVFSSSCWRYKKHHFIFYIENSVGSE